MAFPPKKSSLPPGVGFLMAKQDRTPAKGADMSTDDDPADDPNADGSDDGTDQGTEDGDPSVSAVDPQLEDAVKKLLAAYGPKQLKDAVMQCTEKYGTDPQDDSDEGDDTPGAAVDPTDAGGGGTSKY